MYNYELKVYKNNHNLIDFVVRDNDRKPVRLIDCRIDVIIQNTETGRTVLEKQAKVTDEVKGRAQLAITSGDTANWLLGGYEYNVKVTRPGGAQEFLFLDTMNSAKGVFELLPAVGGELIPAQTILADKFTPITFQWEDNDDWRVSGALAAYNQVGANTGLFTVVIYTTGWDGEFRIQASLDNLAPTDKSWFAVPLVPLQLGLMITPQSPSPHSYGFSVNAQWIRFMYQPHINNVGEFNKVVYKIS